MSPKGPMPEWAAALLIIGFLGVFLVVGWAMENAHRSVAEIEASDLTRDASQICEPPRIVLVRPGVTPPNATYHSSSMPPERFRGDVQATVFFTSPANVERICGGGAKPICGFRRIACVKGGRIVLPHPRDFGTESFGRYTAHEIAHVNGWPAEHGE